MEGASSGGATEDGAESSNLGGNLLAAEEVDTNGYLILETDDDEEDELARLYADAVTVAANPPRKNGKCNGVARVQFEEADDDDDDCSDKADTVVLEDGRVVCSNGSPAHHHFPWIFPSQNGKSNGLSSPDWSPSARANKSHRSRTESGGTYSSNGSSSTDDESSSSRLEITPPDGGWGWVVVMASFLVNAISDGITFSFGVIFVEFLQYFGESKSKTAWIGSLFMAIPLISGPIASGFTDRYGCRRVTIAGALLASLGFVLSSFTNSLGMLCLTFGLFAGFGLSLCCVGSVVIVAYYFEKKRSFATGLSVCGSGIGTFIFAPFIHFLLEEYGWRGTMLILAGCFLNMVVCGALMRDLEGSVRRKRHRSIKSLRTATSSESFSVKSQSQPSRHHLGSKDLEELKRVLLQTGTSIEFEQNGNYDYRQNRVGLPCQHRGCSSLICLPTFIRSGEIVPLEVLEMLSSNRNIYDIILQNYPSLLLTRSASDQGQLNAYQHVRTPVNDNIDFGEGSSGRTTAELEDVEQTKAAGDTVDCDVVVDVDAKEEPKWIKRPSVGRRVPAAYLNDLKLHRHSLTYRGAMLNICRYRLRASSCPDIYRNSISTIAKDEGVWVGTWRYIKAMAMDMVDVSYFTNVTFLLFTLSNFILYTWYDVPYVYTTDYAIHAGYTEEDGSYLISIIGIVNMIGMIVLGYIGDKPWANANLVYAFCMVLCGGTLVLFPLLNDYAFLCLICGSFGFFVSVNYALSSVILVQVISLDRFTNAYGLLLMVQGLANLIGPPFAGWLSDITGTYDLPFYAAGVCIALSGLILLAVPFLLRWRRERALGSKGGDGEPPTTPCSNVITGDDLI